MKTVVIGSGSWGTALAQVLADNKEEVIIYGIEKSEIDDINLNHENSKYFEGVELNPNLKATDDITVVKDADIVLLAVPTFAIEGICLQIDPYLKNNIIVVNVSKGFHPETSERMSEVIRRCISKEHLSSVVSLIGPSHAEEVVIRLLTTIDAVSLKEEDAQAIQRTFSNNYLRIYTGDDEIGSELGVAIKNVMAIASGILSGLGYQDNTRAALITRGLQEMIRYGVFFGGKQQTFMGLTGIGDLIVTCTSIHSRNFEAGYQIGKENDVTNFLKYNKKTVEGVRTAKIVHKVAKQNNIDMPICEEVYQILFEGKEPKTCANDLMLRELKKEF
ncbi:NAD(P)H-dependent glycerol-3-phosphate dehydrogenase [Faecalitalea cylindroides]|uniref:NAD(P)H-dependent glycerol-3-phosphate dehydrogenase n=1 Tax=Faecalitalea cylindroides TaxID=39483 RepID=UPI00195D7C34|nr:NAD(P)H-dependent glycerol-3-phosphate dehydrogenase [Faecalitalea cylindroides]MBM6653296.1 NAD(P)-dependent glycerol-3-phosphate dehydrogenase [Faecalitalea cylindroides]